MAKWQPASPEAVTAFHQMTEGLPGIEPRKMFGYVCVFAHGYLCIGTHEVGIVMRLPEAARGEFLTKYNATIFVPMANRPMREYVVVPPTLYTQRISLRKWAEKSVAYVTSLPAKPPKAAKNAIAKV